MPSVYLGLGSNVGVRQEYLELAIKELQTVGKITKKSKVYQTKPWGNTNQADFLNMCLVLKTVLTPEELLNSIKAIEQKLGRKHREHWGPREIDIDILFYDEKQINKDNLTIPHKNLAERAFVLVPLAEIAPNFIHPTLNKSVSSILALVDTSGVRLYG